MAKDKKVVKYKKVVKDKDSKEEAGKEKLARILANGKSIDSQEPIQNSEDEHEKEKDDTETPSDKEPEEKDKEEVSKQADNALLSNKQEPLSDENSDASEDVEKFNIGEIVDALRLLLFEDYYLKGYALKVLKKRKKTWYVEHSSMSQIWLILREGGRSTFYMKSLLRVIKALPDDSLLYRYFKDYNLVGY